MIQNFCTNEHFHDRQKRDILYLSFPVFSPHIVCKCNFVVARAEFQDGLFAAVTESEHNTQLY